MMMVSKFDELINSETFTEKSTPIFLKDRHPSFFLLVTEIEYKVGHKNRDKNRRVFLNLECE